MTWKQMKKVAKPLPFKWKTKTGRQGGSLPPCLEGKLVMGTRKEALGKVSSALKELTVACIGWPWIKKRPMQFEYEFFEYEEMFNRHLNEIKNLNAQIENLTASVSENSTKINVFYAKYDALHDSIKERLGKIDLEKSSAKYVAKKFQINLDGLRYADKRITALEKTVAEYAVANISSPKKTKSHEEYVSTPAGEEPTRHFVHGVRNTTKEELAEYANWARDAGEFAPISYNGSDGPLAQWGENKRSRMLRLMLDLRLLKITTEGGYGGPKQVVFAGALKTWKYTGNKIEKVSIELFKEGKGKWLGTKAIANLEAELDIELDTPPDMISHLPEPETVEGLMEAAQIAEDAGLMDEYIELYARAEELQDKLDNEALSNGAVTYLPEHKDEGAEQPNYHVSAPKTDLGDGWAEKYRDKRGNREY